MATKRGDRPEKLEGHGESSKAPSVSKGTYMQVGTVIELTQKATSVNQKTGHEGAGREGA